MEGHFWGIRMKWRVEEGRDEWVVNEGVYGKRRRRDDGGEDDGDDEIKE